jgi:mono/diheme cytochrome c family protein
MKAVRKPGLAWAMVVLFAALMVFLAFRPASAEPPPGDQRPQAKPLDEPIRTFLAKHCQDCHRIDKPKGHFHLDRLTPDFSDKAVRERWLAVLEQLKTGAMPPKGKPRPAEKEVATLTDWIDASVTTGVAAQRRTQGRVVCRRLNRIEYENTVRDLLAIEADLKELLALDSSMDGFDNVGTALHVSSFAMERYLAAADTALSLAISNRPKPPQRADKRYSLKETHQIKHGGENVFRLLSDDTVVCFTSVHWQSVSLSPFYPPDRGTYRFRISASGFQSNGKPVTFRVMSGGGGMGGLPAHLISYFDAPADKPTVFEFVDRMEARTTISILPHGLTRSNIVHKEGADNFKGVGLAVHWVEVEGPLNDTWPPASHRRVFGDVAQGPAPNNSYRDRVEVVSKDPAADADRILRPFVRRAYRRAVTDDDIKPFADLVQAKLAEKRTFEQAMRAALMAVMVAPDFLFLREKPGKLDDFALASRLSYFLWSTMPDDELLDLAEQKKLSQPDVLRQQVERLLKSPKARAFTENFVGQWLGLRDIDFTEPSHLLYPEYDQMLRASMVRETELFFAEVLKDDLSLTNFVSSDFTMLNGRLARHYCIPDVDGWEFRKVALPKDSHRGGVLTMASVLKTSANGTSTSPVVRGAWVLERILGTPPPRPPADVPAIDPDTRGATTIRQQLAKHRQVPTCAACHARIDPPGFALESFDVIGGWRDNYRTTGRGESVVINGQRMPYLKGPKVDAGDVMPDGQRFSNIDEFKALLLQDKDQLARALAEKLVTYATGGAPEAVDKPEIEAMVRKVRDKNYGFRTLIQEIVQSQLFRNK